MSSNRIEFDRAVILTRQLCQPAIDDFAADVGQAEVAALIAVRQLEVVEAEQVQQRGVEIVHVNGVFRHDRRLNG